MNNMTTSRDTPLSSELASAQSQLPVKHSVARKGSDETTASTGESQLEALNQKKTSNPPDNSGLYDETQYFVKDLNSRFKRISFDILKSESHYDYFQKYHTEFTKVKPGCHTTWIAYCCLVMLSEHNMLVNSRHLVVDLQRDFAPAPAFGRLKDLAYVVYQLTNLRVIIEDPISAKIIARTRLTDVERSSFTSLIQKRFSLPSVIIRRVVESTNELWMILNVGVSHRLASSMVRRILAMSMNSPNDFNPQALGLETKIQALLRLEKTGLIEFQLGVDYYKVFDRTTFDTILAFISELDNKSEDVLQLLQSNVNQGFFDNIGNTARNLDELTEKLNKSSDEVLPKLGEVLTGVTDATQEMRETVGSLNERFDTVQETMDDLRRTWSFNGMKDNVKDLFANISEKVSNFFSKIFDFMKNLTEMFWPLIAFWLLEAVHKKLPPGIVKSILDYVLPVFGFVGGYKAGKMLAEFFLSWFGPREQQNAPLFYDSDDDVPLVRPTENNVNQIYEFDDYSQPLALAYIAMGCDFSKKNEIIKAVKDFPGFTAGVSSIAKALLGLAINMSAWISKLTGVDIDIAARLDTEYREWYFKANNYLVHENYMTMDISTLGLAIMESVIEDGRTLVLNYFKAKQTPMVNLVSHHLKLLEKAYVECLTASRRYADKRIMPVCLVLSGPPGCGKSQFANFIANQWCENMFQHDKERLARYRANPSQHVYTRTSEKWLDGLTPMTEVIIHDDIGSTKASTAEDSKWVELIQEVNETAVAVAQSEADKKGNIRYNQSLTILTTNCESVDDNFITEIGAVYRRMHVIVRVGNIGERASTANYDSFRPDIYEFVTCKQTGPGNREFRPTNVSMGSVELFATLVGFRKKHQEFFERSNSKRQNVSDDFAKQVNSYMVSIAEYDGMTEEERVREGAELFGVSDEQYREMLQRMEDNKNEPIELEPEPTSPGNFDQMETEGRSTALSTAEVLQFPRSPEPIRTTQGFDESLTVDIFANKLWCGSSSATYEDVEELPIPDILKVFGTFHAPIELNVDRDGFIISPYVESQFNWAAAYAGNSFNCESKLKWAFNIGAYLLRPDFKWFPRLVVPIPVFDNSYKASSTCKLVQQDLEGRTRLVREVAFTANADPALARYRIVAYLANLVSGDMLGADFNQFVTPQGDVTEYTITQNVIRLFGRDGIYTKSIVERVLGIWGVIRDAAVKLTGLISRPGLLLKALKNLPKLVFNGTITVSERVVYTAKASVAWFNDNCVSPAYRSVKKAYNWMISNWKTVTVALGAITGIVWWFKNLPDYVQENNEAQSSEVNNYGYSKQARASTLRRDRHKFNRQRGTDLKHGSHNQGVAPRVYEEVVPLIQRNLWSLNTENGVHLGYIFALGGRRFLLPRHFYIRTKNAAAENKPFPWVIKNKMAGMEFVIPFPSMTIVHDFGSGRDLIILEFNNLRIPEQRSILHHFATTPEASFIFTERLPRIGIVSETITAVCDAIPSSASVENEVLYTNRVIPTASISITENDHQEVRRDLISYPIPTKKGSCGVPVIHGDKIVAMHTAGNGIWGHAARIDLGDLRSAYQDDYLQTRGEEMPDDMFPEFDLKFEDFDTINNGYDMSVHNGMPIAVTELPSSTFVKTDMVSYGGFDIDFPPPIRVPVNPSNKNYPVARKAYQIYETSINLPLLSHVSIVAGNHFRSYHFPGGFEPYSLKQAIEGIPGTSFGPMDTTTSPGYPESARGITQKAFFSRNPDGTTKYGPLARDLLEEVMLQYSLSTQGGVPGYIFSDNLKAELRSPAKVDIPRLISGSPKSHHLLARAFFGPFIRWATDTKDVNPFLIGTNPATDWNTMEMKFREFGERSRHCAGDFKEYDARTCLDTMLAVLNAFEILAGPWGAYGTEKGKTAAKVRRALIVASVESYHVRGKLIEQWQSGWSSGNLLTALWNSAGNLLINMYCFAKSAADDQNDHTIGGLKSAADEYFLYVYPKFMGDDNRFAVRSEASFFNMVSLSNHVKDFGHVYTDTKKDTETRTFMEVTETDILKRKSVFHKDLGVYVGALSLDVLTDMVHYTVRGKEVEVIRQRADGALRELALHERQVWDEWMPRFISFVGPVWTPQFTDYEMARDAAMNWNWAYAPPWDTNRADPTQESRVTAIIDTTSQQAGPEHDVKLFTTKEATQDATLAALNYNNESQMADATPNEEVPTATSGTAVASEVSDLSHNITTKFADDTFGYLSELPNVIDIPLIHIKSITTPGAQSIIDYLQRPARLTSGSLQSTDVGVVWKTDLNLLYTSLKLPKLMGIYTVRADWLITIQVNGDRFQAGRYILGWLPSGGVSITTTPWYNAHMANLMTITQLPHVELDIAKQTHVSLKVPFTSIYSHSTITTGGVQNSSGTVFLIPYAPLIPGGGTSSAGFTIWGSMENVQLGSPTVNQMAGDAATHEAQSMGSGPVTKVLDKIKTTANIFGRIPILAPFTTQVSWLLGVTMDAAKIWGFSKPTNLAAPPRMVRQILPYLANADQTAMSKPLGFLSENQVVQNLGVARTNIDEMSFDYIKKIYSYIGSFTWSASDATDAVIYSLDVGVSCSQAYGKGITFPPCTYITQHFAKIRGGYRFRFKMVKTEFPRGRIAISFAPGTTTNPYSFTTSEYLYREIVDVSTTSEFEVCVPYLIPTPWVLSNTIIGTLRIMVVDPLAAPTTVANYIPIIVEMSGDDDLSWACPVQWNYEPYVPSVAQMADAYVTTPCADLGSPNKILNHSVEAVGIGEVVLSFRTLIKRANWVNSLTSFSLPSGGYWAMFPYAVTPVMQAASLTGALQRDVAYGDIITEMSMIYAFSTGGMRAIIRFIGQGPVSVTSRIDPWSGYGAGYTSGSLDTNTGNNRSLTYPAIEGPLDVQIPCWNGNYARANANQICNSTAGTIATEPTANSFALMIGNRDSTEPAAPFHLMRSGADDLHFSRYVSTVPMVARGAT